MLCGQWLLMRKTVRKTVFPFCMFWLKPGPDTGFQKESFEPAGSTRFHLDGPGCAPGGARELVPWTPIIACGRVIPTSSHIGDKVAVAAL